MIEQEVEHAGKMTLWDTIYQYYPHDPKIVLAGILKKKGFNINVGEPDRFGKVQILVFEEDRSLLPRFFETPERKALSVAFRGRFLNDWFLEILGQCKWDHGTKCKVYDFAFQRKEEVSSGKPHGYLNGLEELVEGFVNRVLGDIDREKREVWRVDSEYTTG